ncbi:MAG: arsenate reductase family protein [Flavobacteriales bacterium]
MKLVYHLGTCSTCKRILDAVSWPDDVSFIDIKKQQISPEVLEFLKAQYGSYEALFSKKAKRYTEVKEGVKGDEDYKRLILSDYTFLKRPVVLYNDFYSIGNDRRVVERLTLNFNAC